MSEKLWTQRYGLDPNPSPLTLTLTLALTLNLTQPLISSPTLSFTLTLNPNNPNPTSLIFTHSKVAQMAGIGEDVRSRAKEKAEDFEKITALAEYRCVFTKTFLSSPGVSCSVDPRAQVRGSNRPFFSSNSEYHSFFRDTE